MKGDFSLFLILEAVEIRKHPHEHKPEIDEGAYNLSHTWTVILGGMK